MSSRTRVRAVVAAVALAAAGIAVGVALVSRDPDEPVATPPPLELGITLAGDADARALVAAERAYDEGRREAARERFRAVLRRSPGSIEAAIGLAVSSWPDGTTDRLRALVEAQPESGVARLHLGLALLGEGDAEAAAAQWREAERRDPDTPAAIRAEDLLHPEMPPGRPFFLLDGSSGADLEALAPQAQLDELERRARQGDAADSLLLGAVLQRLGRPVSARTAFDRAVELDPDDVAARAAAAVARFDKDDPSQAFSRLGPLVRTHPRAAVVRFHLGLMLLWLRQVDASRTQLRQARAAGAGTIYASEADALLGRLAGI